MDKNFTTVKFVCKVCGQEKEVQVRIPIICSKACRNKNFSDSNRRRFAKLREEREQLKNINGQENRGGENTDNLGQNPAGENRLDTPPQPVENTGGEQGQA